MILLHNFDKTNNIAIEFESIIEIFKKKNVTITNKYISTIHCGNIRQAAQIILPNDITLKMGDKAKVKFRFISHPEFLEIGGKFLFRDGTTVGAGRITDITPISGEESTINQKKITKGRKRVNIVRLKQV